jgi:hypothetical protein
MRPIIKYEEAQNLIKQIPLLSAETYENQKTMLLKEHYQAILQSCDCVGMLRLIKNKYNKRGIVNKTENKLA